MSQLFPDFQRKPTPHHLLKGIPLLLLFLLPEVSAAALVSLIPAQRLSQLSAEVTIVDARPFEAWRQGHIPGAVSLDWQQYTETGAQQVAYRKLASGEIARRLGELGIDENSTLVIYGDADSSWGGEGWVCWLLRSLGHRGELFLLDGGIQSWRHQSGELTSTNLQRPPVVYTVRERPELDITTAELQQQKGVQLVDTRSFFEWLRGSISGAVRIHWREFYHGQERRPIGREKLRSLLQEHGVDPDQPIIYYCSGGIRSAYAWTVHELAGLQTAINYEGGMEAWRRLR